MTEPTKCPRCGSMHTEREGDEDFAFVVCLDCGYDGEDYEAEEKGSSGKGGGGSPYKRGGPVRTQKR